MSKKKAKKKVKWHPWDKWFQEDKFTLVEGRDYTCMSHSMSVQIRNAAMIRGIRASVFIQRGVKRGSVRRDRLVVQVLERSG